MNPPKSQFKQWHFGKTTIHRFPLHTTSLWRKPQSTAPLSTTEMIHNRIFLFLKNTMQKYGS